MRILIVDDDDLTLSAYSKILTSEGYVVSLAGSLKQALAELNKHYPDIVLLDIKLPDGSGLELIPELKKNTQVKKIIIVSGFSKEKASAIALSLGATDYMTKPMDITKLKEILARTTNEAND
jgi:DNA-binding response OmpR family regulator